MQRLLIRNFQDRKDVRSTRKNLRDLLKSILSVLYADRLEFMSPFQVYGEQYQFLVFSNFSFQLCFVLLKRQKEFPHQVKEFRPIFSKLWLVMLHNFVNMRKRTCKVMQSPQKFDEYFIESGKLFQTMLFNTILNSCHSIGFVKFTAIDIRDSKPELTMPKCIVVYWKVVY